MKKIKKRNVFIILIVVLVFVLIFFFLKEEVVKIGQKKLTPLEEEINNLVKEQEEVAQKGGNWGYFKVSSDDVYCKFISGEIYPERPKLGEEQYLAIELRDPEGIKSVFLKIQDERGQNTIEEIDLELVKGDVQNGFWGSSWQVHDVENIFRTVFFAENVNGEKNDLTYFVKLNNDL